MEIWLQEIKNHTANCRASRPTPGQDSLSWPQIIQLHIIKGSLLSWVNNLPPAISSVPHLQTGHKYCIVFTSTCPGLVAAEEITRGKNLPWVSLYPEELNNFLQCYPDNGYTYHLHIWSHFLEELDSETIKIAARYPISGKEKYWLHIEGVMQGQKLGRGTEHLWSWNGSQPSLLKKNLFHWAS